jgi:hypothetical protein
LGGANAKFGPHNLGFPDFIFQSYFLEFAFKNLTDV